MFTLSTAYALTVAEIKELADSNLGNAAIKAKLESFLLEIDINCQKAEEKKEKYEYDKQAVSEALSILSKIEDEEAQVAFDSLPRGRVSSGATQAIISELKEQIARGRQILAVKLESEVHIGLVYRACDELKLNRKDGHLRYRKTSNHNKVSEFVLDIR